MDIFLNRIITDINVQPENSEKSGFFFIRITINISHEYLHKCPGQVQYNVYAVWCTYLRQSLYWISPTITANPISGRVLGFSTENVHFR